MFVRRANCSAAADVGACLAALPPHKVCGACGAQCIPAAMGVALLHDRWRCGMLCVHARRRSEPSETFWPLRTALVTQVIDAIPWDVFPFWSHAQDCEMPAKADHMAALLMSALTHGSSFLAHLRSVGMCSVRRCHVCTGTGLTACVCAGLARACVRVSA